MLWMLPPLAAGETAKQNCTAPEYHQFDFWLGDWDAFDADNPGRWAFHCHNLYHMMTGMMMEFRYEGIAV